MRVRRSVARILLLLSLAAPSWCAVTVFLTRHAEVPPGETDPSLTAAGEARAKLLASMLSDVKLDMIVVSEFKRTQQTAEVVAETQHLTPVKKTEAADVAAVIRAKSSGTILVVGHSNTIPDIISQLGGTSFPIEELEFDNLAILIRDRGRTSTVHLRYGDFASGGRQVMEISFVKSGGISPITRVQGTINLNDGAAKVTGDASYHRQLAPEERDSIKQGADPTLLSQTATAIDNKAKKGRADVEHYLL